MVALIVRLPHYPPQEAAGKVSGGNGAQKITQQDKSEILHRSLRP
jgi:hypothetical protein